MYTGSFRTDLGATLERVDKRVARRWYESGHTLLIAAENPDTSLKNIRFARLEGGQAVSFDQLVESFERNMCGGDTKRYAFFYAPTSYVHSLGTRVVSDDWDATTYMRGVDEWTLDGLKTEGVTV